MLRGEQFKLVLIYALPALIALMLTTGAFYHRTTEVTQILVDRAATIYEARTSENPESPVETAAREEETRSDQLDQIYLQLDLDELKELTEPSNVLKYSLDHFLYVAGLVALLTLLPYTMLGSQLALNQKPSERRKRTRVAGRDFLVKLIVALIIAQLWIYVLNPAGRGASITESYIAAIDPTAHETLPIYLTVVHLPLVLCGFLGWYLQVLTHFFVKAATNDTSSTRIYSLFLKRFIVTWVIAMVLGYEFNSPLGQFTLFLIGFFPFAGVSLIQEYGSKQFGNFNDPLDDLTMIPSLSRWQILRLEEEAIETIPELASTNPEVLASQTPLPEKLIQLWVDSAKLIAIIGVEKYKTVSQLCITASEFINRAEEEEFRAKLQEIAEISNPDEIARLLQTRFASEK